MKSIKVIKSKKPKSKSRIAKTKKPTQQQRQTQNVTVNVSAPRKRLIQKAPPKPPAQASTQGLPIRMNNPVQAPIVINKDTNQLSELIKSLQQVHAEPPRVPNTLEKTKSVPIETQTEPEFDEQGVYTKLQNASKGVSLEKQFQTPVKVNEPLSLLGETVTTDYPAFRSIETQTGRSFRIGDILRDAGEVDLSRERQQVSGRGLGRDSVAGGIYAQGATPSIFNSAPPSTSLVSSVVGNQALEYVEPLSDKHTAPLLVTSKPSSLVSLAEQSTPASVVLPTVDLPPTFEGAPEVVEVQLPDEPPVAEEVKQTDIPMAFGGTFAPVQGLEPLNLFEKEKPVPSSLVKTPYLGGAELPPIEEEGLNAIKTIHANIDLFPKQGHGLLPVAEAIEIHKSPMIRYQELAKSFGLPYNYPEGGRIHTAELRENIIKSQPAGYVLPIYTKAISGPKVHG